MNIHFSQTERKSHIISQLLMAVAAFIFVMTALTIILGVDIHFSVPTISIEAAQPTDSTLPVAIPAPLPPTADAQSISTPAPVENVPAVVAPQPIPAPAPSVP